jgi:hypothetical protein
MECDQTKRTKTPVSGLHDPVGMMEMPIDF